MSLALFRAGSCWKLRSNMERPCGHFLYTVIIVFRIQSDIPMIGRRDIRIVWPRPHQKKMKVASSPNRSWDLSASHAISNTYSKTSCCITIRSPFLFHHSHHEYPFIPEIATLGRSCWWWWWWWWRRRRRWWSWSWSWWSWCVLVLVLVLVLALGIVVVLVIVILLLLLLLLLLLVFVLALALAVVVGYLLLFIVWCLLFDVVCCLLFVVGCWLRLWFWLWLWLLLLLVVVLLLWFRYELQPKFRWTESSIRDILCFWKLSWCLENDH